MGPDCCIISLNGLRLWWFQIEKTKAHSHRTRYTQTQSLQTHTLSGYYLINHPTQRRRQRERERGKWEQRRERGRAVWGIGFHYGTEKRNEQHQHQRALLQRASIMLITSNEVDICLLQSASPIIPLLNSAPKHTYTKLTGHKHQHIVLMTSVPCRKKAVKNFICPLITGSASLVNVRLRMVSWDALCLKSESINLLLQKRNGNLKEQRTSKHKFTPHFSLAIKR